MISRKAYAKINLGLEVLGRRDDGYHDIVSVMQLVDLHDTLTFHEDKELWVDCDHPILAAEGKNNLVWRAARLLRETVGGDKGAHIELQKAIPLAGGLGGGSSDAAATLMGLAELWGLRLSPEEMRNLAALLGSDVPFFLVESGTALVEGRGDRVTPLPPPPPAWVVLVSQPFSLDKKTQRLYGSLERHDMSNGIITRQLGAALRRGEFPSASLLYNAFERVAYRVFEGLDDVRQAVVRAGGDDVRLSGSGPTLFVLFSDEEKARSLYERLVEEGLRVFLTRFERLNA